MAETGGKKGKKKKPKTVNLIEFLNDSQTTPASLGPVFNTKSSTNWADESEDLPTEVDSRWPEEAYGGISSVKRQMKLAELPTAPRASLEVEIDYSKIPEQPPYTAFLGNLPYDVEKIDIMTFFQKVKISEVRLPQDAGGGRPKGFGYAEFDDRESLIQALTMNNETLRGRKLRIDIAGQNQGGGGGGGGGGDRERVERDDGPDVTMGDWRAFSDDSRSGGRYGSSNGYQDRNFRDGNRFDRRNDEGGWGRDNDRGRYNDYDDQRYPDHFDEWRRRDRHDFYRSEDRYDGYHYGDSYQRDSWGGRYGERDRNNGRSGRESSDPYAGEEFTRDQARPPAATRGPSSQNYDSRNDREDRFFGDRDKSYGGRDRGYGDRDRGYGDRGYGDRDRGYADRDRGYSDRDRGYGERDRGYGDREKGYSDRDRGYGDRDRGYGDHDRGFGDRDRGYGDRDRGYSDRDRGYGDRDRGYGDRDRGYGDRDRGYGGRDRGYGDRSRGYGDRERGYGDGGRDYGDPYRRDYGSRGDQDNFESAKERPKLQLKPRTKPVEEKTSDSATAESRSSIFGGAKPVDTTAKEREIEEKLEKLKIEPDLKKEHESFKDTTQSREEEVRSRRDSGRSSEGESRSRKDSGRSNEGEKLAINHGRGDSEKSLETEGLSTNKDGVHEISPPVINVWKQRLDVQKTSGDDKAKKETISESSTEKPGSERPVERKVMNSNGPSFPVGRGSNPKQQSRSSERGGGGARGRGRGRGEHRSPTNKPAGDERNMEEKKERREKKATELKKVEEQPPVFHQNSKFSLLMDTDEDEESENAET